MTAIQELNAASRWWIAAGCIVVLLLLCNFPLLIGRATPPWDASDYFGPAFSLVADHAKHGRLLMWDPWVAAGSPDVAEPELGTTSPLLLLIGILSPNPQAGFVAYWLTLWTIGSMGMLLLAKHLGSPLWGALVVTLGYTASGFYTGHAEHTSSLCSVAYLPWIIWRFDRALQTRKYWFAIEAGVLFGLSTLGGYPQLTILTPGFLALWLVGRVFFGYEPATDKEESRRRSLLRACIFLAVTIGIGLVICSPAYVAIFKDTPGYSDRVAPRSRPEAISSNLLPAGALTTFASPFIALLNLQTRPVWPVSDVSMVNVYMGAGALVLALLGIRFRIGWRVWLLLMAVFFAACAMGNQLPVRGWLYDFIPPTRYFRNPALFRIYLILLLAILGALASSDLTAATSILRKRFLPAASLLAIAAFATFFVMFHNRSETWGYLRLPPIHLLTVWLGLIVVGYLLIKGRSSYAFRLIAALAVADFAGTLLISSPTVYSSAYKNGWHAMNTEHVRNLDLTPQGLIRTFGVPAELAESHPNNRNLALKSATLDSYVTLTNRFHNQLIADPIVSAMALGKDRIWFSANPIRVAPSDDAYAQFVRSFHSSGAPAFLLHSPAQMAHLAQPGSSPGLLQLLPCERANITNLSYRANSIAFHYQSPSAGWIMITDRWAPGWQATVNGQPTPVWGADFLFRAIPIASGGNDINLHYRPSGFLPFLGLSWGTLLAFAGIEVTRQVRRKPSETELEQESSRYLYLVSNGLKGVPHPLFDRAYYLRNNPDVVAHNVDPLVHYMTAGALELRNPHALFDSRNYVEQHPEVLTSNINPLLHFLNEGANRGYNPNPLFDIEYYLWKNPEAKMSGMNPLVHFILHGIKQGFDPCPLFGMKDYAARYPDIVNAGTDPLSHYLEFGRREQRIASRALYFSEVVRTPDVSPRASDGRTNPDPSAPLPVFCVYGSSHLDFLKNAVVPAFANQHSSFPVELHFLNYESPEALAGKSIPNVTDWSESRPSGHLGFGESVNSLFKVVQPKECFIICNPDSFPMPGCLARLMKTYLETGAAIVEARQWPSAHPKEFNPETLETPWASGAFDLISSKAFAELGGFDPAYFLYMEDVDLSWRAWLSGYQVLHQPLALCTHATGLHSYQPTRFYLENFYSLRNFLIIAYKFWGELGERISLEYLKSAHLPAELHANILSSYSAVKPCITTVPAAGSNIGNVKILGLNLFHELQH